MDSDTHGSGHEQAVRTQARNHAARNHAARGRRGAQRGGEGGSMLARWVAPTDTQRGTGGQKTCSNLSGASGEKGEQFSNGIPQ